MRRGYIRIRKHGPDETAQRLSLAAAGVNVDEPRGAIYVDGRTDARKHPNDPLPQRTWVIRHLREGDELVVHDAATLGSSADDIIGVVAAIGRQGASLFVIDTDTTYRWHPDAADIAALASVGSKIARREKTTRARQRLADTQRKVTPEVRKRALQLWSDPKVRSAKEVAAILFSEGIKVSVRTLYNHLPLRSDAMDGYVAGATVENAA